MRRRDWHTACEFSKGYRSWCGSRLRVQTEGRARDLKAREYSERYQRMMNPKWEPATLEDTLTFVQHALARDRERHEAAMENINRLAQRTLLGAPSQFLALVLLILGILLIHMAFR